MTPRIVLCSEPVSGFACLCFSPTLEPLCLLHLFSGITWPPFHVPPSCRILRQIAMKTLK
jgi:hypothetical protein